ncbi:cysteine proteinase [Eremomyces bilateralis CBS 781.70]|uniref:Cysteine proteinase n=1 Tax=Eremomyces bilateralis CBS 781.70 TaxID=1392243 RepID=A0A6G1GEM7_9PEZI|nr:cysteine proteinase [Eremomyces bilateralis CBS 781.70]KAF1816565.1 cysteine proteinase [Eremomyces bilateralis CBS 781.70]
MEVNAFFAAVLRGLGYHVVSVGAKVSLATGGGGEGFLGYNHQLSLVTIPNHPHPYAVDVGFGADTPTQPLPLIPSLITRGWHPTSTMKLTRSALPGGADPTPRFWVYEHSRNYGVDGEGQEVEGTKWTPGYAFTEVEFTREDYEVMNVGTMEGVRSLFTRTVVGARFAGWEELVEWGVVKREADGEVVERYGGLVGQVTLMGGVVKVKVRGMVVREVKLGSEEERGEALGRYFGVWLTERGEGNIKGLVSHLK